MTIIELPADAFDTLNGALAPTQRFVREDYLSDERVHIYLLSYDILIFRSAE